MDFETHTTSAPHHPLPLIISLADFETHILPPPPPIISLADFETSKGVSLPLSYFLPLPFPASTTKATWFSSAATGEVVEVQGWLWYGLGTLWHNI